MRTKVEYGEKTYGNDSNAPGYVVRMQRNQYNKNIEINFALDEPAQGRGVGELKGFVRKISLSLPPEACQVLSHGLQVAVAGITQGAVEFRIDETARDSVRPTA